MGTARLNQLPTPEISTLCDDIRPLGPILGDTVRAQAGEVLLPPRQHRRGPAPLLTGFDGAASLTPARSAGAAVALAESRWRRKLPDRSASWPLSDIPQCPS